MGKIQHDRKFRIKTNSTQEIVGPKVKSTLLCMMLGSVSALSVAAQVPARPQITQVIDATHLVTLHGSVHPLVKTASDRGLVNESTPAGHLLLVLNRPAEREAAFQQQIKQMHTPGSPNYHHWLTPAQTGAQFGPADSDLEQVSGWLSSAGFQVNRVSAAKRFVEFSGTVGQVNSAFHTQIHEYLVNGEVHHANSTEVRIPEALSSAIAALSPLNDFRPHPEFVSSGKGSYDGASRKFVPQYTLPSSYSPLLYGVSPADFATQYDLAPLYSASVNGSGVTIGIIDESNVDLTLTNAYRSVFGLKSNPVQVVLDGGDPGILSSSSAESYLDVEIAGAVAPSATVNLYISGASPYQDPLALAAIRAVEDNQADVLSISWGAGEQELGSSGNQFWNAIWEQAAAQGQTVMVSSGDTGQLPDTNYLFQGLFTAPAVNGIASTPWNIAVGGTDFYYSDYASGAPSASSYWNTSNDPTTRGSLKARLSEQVWNDVYGLDAIANGLQRNEIYAGGGGASGCIAINSSYVCSGGYSKPAWQSGPGVPADGVRDIPDVSLFASNGANFSGYVICDYPGYCSPDSSGNFDVDVIGGTSASAPAMAGIMALAVQKYGRQGQAATVLYPLAQQKPAAFHDITLGGNWNVCIQGDGQCPAGTSGSSWYGKSSVYSATTGFDLASGLGSVDAANLVNNWNTVSFRSTTTTLQASPTTITHGANVALSAQVSAASGSGTPTGDVAILTTSTLPSNAGQTSIALSGGSGSTTLNYLPGGTYQLTARYGGDSAFASSTSTAQTFTVAPEKSTLSLAVIGTNGSSASNLTYGVPVNFSAEPIGVNASSSQLDGIATGSVAFNLDSQTTTVPINTGNIASWTAPALSVGSHTASASYSGDASFQSSTAAAQTFSIAKGYPWMNLSVDALESLTSPGWYINPGGSLTMTAQAGPEYGPLSGGTAPVGVAGPTGTVTLCLNSNSSVGVQACTSPTYSQTVQLVASSGKNSLYSTATATFTNLATGYYMPQFLYNGDANWQVHGLDYIATIFVQSTTPLPASAGTLSATPTSIAGNQRSVLSATVTGSGGTAPTGEIDFYDNGVPIAYTILQASTTSATSTATISITSNALLASGNNQLTAYYYGDSVYAGVITNTVTINATQTYGDFTLAPAAPQISVTSGNSASLGLNLISVTGFNSTVSIACTPSSSQFSCSVTPSSATLNGTATASLTITAVLPTSASNRAPSPGPFRRNWPLPTAAALCVLLAVPFRRRRWLSMLCFFALFISAFSLGACGGGGGTSTPVKANGTPAGTYNVVLTATGNSLTHSVKVPVVIQ